MSDGTNLVLTCLGGAAVGAVAGSAAVGVGAVPGAVAGCVGGLMLTGSSGCGPVSTRTPEEEMCIDAGTRENGGSITADSPPEDIAACYDAYTQMCRGYGDQLQKRLRCSAMPPDSSEEPDINGTRGPEIPLPNPSRSCNIDYFMPAEPENLIGLQIPFYVCHQICQYDVQVEFAADDPENPTPGETYECITDVSTMHGQINGTKFVCGIEVTDDPWIGSWPDYCAE